MGNNHLFVIFAVLDVSLAVNLCINCSFFYIYSDYRLPISDIVTRVTNQLFSRYCAERFRIVGFTYPSRIKFARSGH